MTVSKKTYKFDRLGPIIDILLLELKRRLTFGRPTPVQGKGRQEVLLDVELAVSAAGGADSVREGGRKDVDAEQFQNVGEETAHSFVIRHIELIPARPQFVAEPLVGRRCGLFDADATAAAGQPAEGQRENDRALHWWPSFNCRPLIVALCSYNRLMIH